MTTKASAGWRAWPVAIKVYFEFRVFLILLLGFSSGLPLLLVYGTLSAWLHDEGVSLTVIGWFSIASSAYALKFLWAPLVDRFPLPGLTRWIGQRRSWLLLSQGCVVVAILALGAPIPKTHWHGQRFGPLCWLLRLQRKTSSSTRIGLKS